MINEKVYILACCFCLLAFAWQDKVTKKIKSWKMSIDLADFNFVSFSKNKSRTLKSEELEATKNKIKVKIVKTKVEEHKKYVEDKKFLLESLFLPTMSPYPEAITNIVQCPKEFIPTQKKVEDGLVYTLFAGDRYNYGICAQDLIKYRSLYGIFDCREKGIFEIFLFSAESPHSLEQIINTFSCR